MGEKSVLNNVSNYENYEDEIEQVIFDTLKYIYDIEDIDVLFRYLILRQRCVKSLNVDNKRINSIKYPSVKDRYVELDSLPQFILNELCISENIYKNQKLYLCNFNVNSLKNIIDSIHYMANTSVIKDENNIDYCFYDYIDKTWSQINNLAIKNAKKYRDDKYYKYHIVYNRLVLLNEIFGITEIKEVPEIYGFKQDLIINLSIEEQCTRYIHASNFDTNNIKTITEEDLESYLVKNLSLIEEGLTPMKRQFEVEEGKIDILAKDKDGNTVILELKIANDKHLIWQTIYYPDALKKDLKTDKPIRVITVCPDYPDYIRIPLEKIKNEKVSNVEMIKYKANISNGRIVNIIFNKI